MASEMYQLLQDATMKRRITMLNLTPRCTAVTSVLGKLSFCLMLGVLAGCGGGGPSAVGNTNSSTPSAPSSTPGTAALSSISLKTENFLNAVAFGNNTFVTVGDDGKILA